MKTKKVIVIGGVAGGAGAAARARRLSEASEIILLDRNPYISFANCGLPYHIGGTISKRDQLMVTTPEAMAQRYRIDVRTSSEAIAIDREAREVEIKNLETGEIYRESYDAVILSPGAIPMRPPIDGIENQRILSLRNLDDMDQIIAAVGGNQTAAVVGGGYIGLEMAEALRTRNIQTTLIECAPQVMGTADPEMATPLHHELIRNGVDLRLKETITAFEPIDNGLRLRFESGKTLDVGIVILAIGVRPETTLAVQAGLQLGPRGGIQIDNAMQTSDPSIYAVGDAAEINNFSTGQPALIPLAGPAGRQGRIAADQIFGRDSRYVGTQGTAICKVFDLAIGMTGLNEKTARRENILYEKIYVHMPSHASYYPGATSLSLKLLFDPNSGKVLGAQAVGANGVDKRMDVLAVAVRAGLTVYDLEEMELSYAPPFGSAKDPVNYAGFVAGNVLRKDMRICHTADLDFLAPDQVILDVRSAKEIATGTPAGSVHIPLEQIRERLSELDQEKEYLIVCRVGRRAYLCCRILEQKGFRARNLTGGYITYMHVKGLDAKKCPKH